MCAAAAIGIMGAATLASLLPANSPRPVLVLQAGRQEPHQNQRDEQNDSGRDVTLLEAKRQCQNGVQAEGHYLTASRSCGKVQCVHPVDPLDDTDKKPLYYMSGRPETITSAREYRQARVEKR